MTNTNETLTGLSYDELGDILTNGVSIVKFVKKDGTTREMYATTDMTIVNNIPGYGGKLSLERGSDLTRRHHTVMDLQLNELRIINWNTLENVQPHTGEIPKIGDDYYVKKVAKSTKAKVDKDIVYKERMAVLAQEYKEEGLDVGPIEISDDFFDNLEPAHIVDRKPFTPTQPHLTETENNNKNNQPIMDGNIGPDTPENIQPIRTTKPKLSDYHNEQTGPGKSGTGEVISEDAGLTNNEEMPKSVSEDAGLTNNEEMPKSVSEAFKGF